jgi:hypothetical protein
MNKLLLINKEQSAKMIAYYKRNYDGYLPIITFINLPFSYQLGFILDYLTTQNIGIIADTHNYQIYYVNPELVANKLILQYQETGVFTDVIEFVETDLNNVMFTYRRAIEHVLNEILIPF